MPSKDKFLFHLKKEGQTKAAVTSGLLYQTLCGLWVYDSIAADADCRDRWVTCPVCAKKDPHPEFQQSEAPSWR
jgi:hypothetical protein